MLFLVLGNHSHDVLHILLTAKEDGTPLVELPGHKVENGLPGKIVCERHSLTSLRKVRGGGGGWQTLPDS